MDDLVQFLCDRLDEDEKIARATVPGPWEWTGGADTWGQCGPTLVHEPGTEETEVLAVVSRDVGYTKSSNVSCCGSVASGSGGWSKVTR